MQIKAVLFAVLALALSGLPARAAIITKETPYKDGNVDLMGYLAYDDTAKAPAPGVIVVHEWWGQNDYVRRRARELAALGYVAFAVDMYGKSVQADTPEQASALVKPFYADRELMRTRAGAALDALKAQPQVDQNNLAAIGYCFGGTVALELARGGEPLQGVVSFHGGLTAAAPVKPGAVKAEILALNGGADASVTQEDKDAFIKEMTDAGARFKSIDYPGATHAFTNPAATEIGEKFNLPIAYDAEADKKSFAEMQAFLKRIFTPTAPNP